MSCYIREKLFLFNLVKSVHCYKNDEFFISNTTGHLALSGRYEVRRNVVRIKSKLKKKRGKSNLNVVYFVREEKKINLTFGGQDNDGMCLNFK